MRSAFIVCSLAVTLLAVPVPLSNDVAVARRESAGPVGTLMDKIYVREAGAVNRINNRRDAEPEAEPGLRHADRREALVDTIHVRGADPSHRSNSWGRREAEADPSHRSNSWGRRKAEADPQDRPNWVRTAEPAKINQREAEAEAEPQHYRPNWVRTAKPAKINQREAEAEALIRTGQRREAEPAKINQREAEAAPIVRTGLRREAEPAEINQREAEAV